MRIVSGIYKGRRFNQKIPPGVRPTTDRDRESIFNIISNLLEIEASIFLDLFSGTGFMGIEAISRGAEKVYFVDRSYKSLSFTKMILEELKIEEDNYSIHKIDSIKYLKESKINYDVVFIDPPYNKPELINQALEYLQKQPIDSLIIIESDKKLVFDKSQFYELRTKESGTSTFYFIRNVK